MGLETFTGIWSFNASNPVTGDAKTEGDDHFRGMKSAFLYTFPNITGIVTPTHTAINNAVGGTFTVGQISVYGYAADTGKGAIYFDVAGTKYLLNDGSVFSFGGQGLSVTTLAASGAASAASFSTTSGAISSFTTITAGGLIYGNNGGGNGLGKITVSGSDPSGGSNGDIWFKT